MLWIKSFHIMAVIAWFAGLLYLPRLFVYHAGTTSTEAMATFKVMERRLYRAIMQPAMAVAVGLGLWLWTVYWPGAGWWVYLKAAFAAVLVAYHFYLGRLVKTFAADRNKRSALFYRWLNEFPTPFLVAIVLLVEFKP